MTEEKEKKTKMITTTLDRLPRGHYTAENTDFREKPKVPEGVKNSELMKDALMIAWPSLIELILTSLTGIVDQIMVGNMAGNKGVIGLAAVSLSIQPKFLLMTMIMAMNVGTTAIIARYRGQKNREKSNQVFKQGMLLNILVSAAMMIIGLLFTAPLISLMAGRAITEETKQLAGAYFRVQLYGFVPFSIAMSITAALRGIGDSRTSMVYNTTANVVNVCFNYLLIYGKFGFPEMGVVGASLATVIGQMVAFFMASIVMLQGKRYIYFSFKEKFEFNKEIFGEVTRIGIPSMIEQCLMRVGVIVFTRLVSGLGEIMYAAHTICMSVMSFSFMLGQAFANATTTLMGQSLGKARFDMAKLYMRATRIIGLFASCGVGILMIIFSGSIMTLYNKTPEVIAAGTPILIMLGCMMPLQGDQFIISGGLRGAGDTRFNAWCSAITVLGVRTGVVILLVGILHMGLWGAWIAILADNIVRILICWWRYSSGKWAKRALY